jgi:hypothetical protein
MILYGSPPGEDSGPVGRPAPPPLPVVLRVPRFAEAPQPAPAAEPTPVVTPQPARRWRRLLARLTLVALVGAAATPWVIRWRPWQTLAEHGGSWGFALEAEEPAQDAPDGDETAPVEGAPTAPASPLTNPATPPTTACAKVAHLEPYILPLTDADGGAP